MTFDARMRSNIIALYIVQGLNPLISLLTFPFLTNTLGAEGFGVLMAAFYAVQYGVLFTDFGFNLSAVREIAQQRDNPQAVARVFWKVNAAKTLLALLACAVLTLLIALIGDWRAHAPVYGFSMIYIISSVFFPQWYFQGFEEFRLVSLLTVVSRVLMLGLLLTLVRGPDDVALAVALQAAPAMLAGALWWCSGWGLKRPAWHTPNRVEMRQSLIESWPFFLSAISTNLYTTSTGLILSFFASPMQMGFYGAAYRLVYVVQGTLIAPLVQATYPRIAQHAQSNPPAALAVIRKAWLLQGGAGLLATVVLIIGAPWIVPLLGKSMTGSASAVAWLAPAILLGALSYVYGSQTLLPFGRERYYSRVLMLAGLLNVLLLFLLLPSAAEPAVRAAQVVVVVELYIVVAFWLGARKVYAGLRA
ncbi:polysaccharide transporter, PST family [Andreprevotia lacus DSM 23236]|jgi:O-antigen/teichoic acid export membrane protein|uniref:Polysaccharide transporter, PST family n=1 Tax=Andreprevotia lacus DSM 23236 TaxID=1121001 RepID=A0A1W1XXH0_9NEIS|nr:oligosaccharide flippase family protein [Andreprevotia lacus]SMC28669.1 polysaccharide transporter, PST family [Andreprevotia lacus DSM 23236]